MAVTKMIAIEYNMWMSFMAMLSNKLKALSLDYIGMPNLSNIRVLPSYPRNLSEFKKPSIIVQKVNTDQTVLGFGGFIGQYFDESQNSYLDAYGIEHKTLIQIDVNGDSNTDRSLITSILTDEVFNPFRTYDSKNLEIYNYAKSISLPVLMGHAKMSKDIDITDLSSDQNHDYVTAIRVDITTIQVMVPNNQDLVDLSKWIKVNQKINL